MNSIYRICFCFLLPILEIKMLKSVKGNDYPNTEKKKTDIVVGIHFDRDYIRCAVSENGNMNIIPNRYGELKTPILITFDKYGTMLLGDAAKVAVHPIVRLYNLQKIIGKNFNEIKSLKDYPFTYEILNYHNKPYLNVQWENGSLEITPEEALAFLFKDIKWSIESYLNENVSQIVLSVPDRYTENQKLALRAAINKGGLRVLKTIKDSVSAIYGYELNEVEEEANILIINVANDSMDVVINVVGDNHIEMLKERFVENFGGNVFHRSLFDYLMSQCDTLKEQTVDDVQELSVGIKSLLETLNVFSELDFRCRHSDRVVRISLSKYKELVQTHVTKLLNVVTRVLMEGELRRSDISQVILIGSGFGVGKMSHEIRDYFFGLDIRCEKDFEEVIVEGVAVAAFLSRNVSVMPSIVLVDIVSANLGIEVYSGVFHTIVPIGSAIPTKMSQQLTTTFNYQAKVKIKILEGQSPFSRGNNFLGEVMFDKVTHGLRNFVRFKVEFDVHRDGTIIFTATDLGSGARRAIMITKDFGKEGQSRRMNDERTMEKDKKFKTVYDLRSEIEPVAYEIYSHILSESAVLRNVESPIDYLVLQQSVQETVLWLENHFLGEAKEVEELKSKFESTVKPILARAYL